MTQVVTVAVPLTMSTTDVKLCAVAHRVPLGKRRLSISFR
jgi:hypothetical protein